jgi:hypothetical protein
VSSWDENLPDVSKWLPRDDASERLANLFFKRCRQIEERILLRVKNEREGSIDNFDAGVGIEDIFREELSHLLPSRYKVCHGTINDRYGKTAGDCDVVLFNEYWFPFIKTGATEVSRKIHFPIEGVYSVLEIKSKMNFDTLDEAMKKLVTCHRLHRSTTPGNRVTENRWVSSCPHSVANPLFTGVVAAGLSPEISFEDVINRFFAISKQLLRSEVVRSLCVLGEGAVTWGVRVDGEVKPARFRDDYEKPIFPIFHRRDTLGSAFYPFVSELLLSLYHCLLAPEDLQAKYGLYKHAIKVPCQGEVSLPPGEMPMVRDPEDPYNFWK